MDSDSMDIGFGESNEYTGLLVRDAGGFMLKADGGICYRLTMLRTPIDEVEKRVIVTGHLTGDDHIEADGVRLCKET
ncbi:DUF5818 domain-containing protein [Parasphingorhabdus sp.]|uniref:DUF5818 domain-containing protein n=1 Tax=Parasphingorhabdus sp. TaxID=2709688 RepID=UPI002F921198